MLSCVMDFFKNLFKSKRRKEEELRAICLKIKHIALLLDGYRRWSRLNGVSIEHAYTRFLEDLPVLFKFVWGSGVPVVSIWLLSDDNVSNRPKDQLDLLYKIFDIQFDSLLALAKKENARIVHIGRKDRAPVSLMKKVSQMEDVTKNFNACMLILAMDYGGKEEIVSAVKKIVQNNIPAAQINTELFSQFTYAGKLNFPIPDLIIRAGDVKRVSGFMSWDLGYSELYFSEKLGPDFSVDDIKKAVVQFSKAERRFGGGR